MPSRSEIEVSKGGIGLWGRRRRRHCSNEYRSLHDWKIVQISQFSGYVSTMLGIDEASIMMEQMAV